MNNTTVDAGWSALPRYLVLIGQGSLISFGNLIIVLAIARYKALRNNKEHILMLGLSLADAINQAAWLMTGSYRISLLYKGVHGSMQPVSDCMNTFPIIFLRFGIALGSMMLLALSIDRLVCVLSPLAYLGLTVTYARRLVASVYVLKFFDTFYLYMNSFDNNKPVPTTCPQGDVLAAITSRPHAFLTTAAMPICAVLSVLVYLVVILLHKKSSNVVHPAHPNEHYELKKQRKVTMTLWVSALCTLFLFVFPISVGIVMRTRKPFIGQAFVLASSLNRLASVFLYPLRHKEIRQALKAMVTWKHMPDDIKLWQENAN